MRRHVPRRGAGLQVRGPDELREEVICVFVRTCGTGTAAMAAVALIATMAVIAAATAVSEE
jgi:hypothetical protein